MHDKVIPSINDDLTNIESLVTSLERLHSREQPTTMNAFLNYLSSSNDSNDDKRTQNLSSITLHDKDEFLKIMRDSKYENCFHSNDDDDDDDDNNNIINNIGENEEDDDESTFKSTINITLGLAMPITLGDALRKKVKNPI